MLCVPEGVMWMLVGGVSSTVSNSLAVTMHARFLLVPSDVVFPLTNIIALHRCDTGSRITGCKHA